jgi:hypothetical protein
MEFFLHFHIQSSFTTSINWSRIESPERQLSLLDPMSDRVSTILVWQNLTVSTREDKQKEILQHIKSSKNFEPKRKSLLHNVSGAITGMVYGLLWVSCLYYKENI